jgi:hypothetical protein
MTTKAASPVVRLSRKRLEALIDRQARQRLHISGGEFRCRLNAGTLDKEKIAVRDIADLVKLAGQDNSRKSRSALR